MKGVKKTYRISPTDWHSTEKVMCLNAYIKYFFMCSGAQILDLQDLSYLREVVLGISLNCNFMSKKYAFECISPIHFM